MEVLSFQGRHKKWGHQDPKEPRLDHSLANSEPMSSSSCSDLFLPPTAFPPVSYSVNGSTIRHRLKSQTQGASGSCPCPSPPPSCTCNPSLAFSLLQPPPRSSFVETTSFLWLNNRLLSGLPASSLARFCLFSRLQSE